MKEVKIIVYKILAITIIIIGMLTLVFRRDNPHIFRDDIIMQNISSVIENIYYYRGHHPSGIFTLFKGDSIPYHFNGYIQGHKDTYYDIAKIGDSIIKQSNSDTLILKRRDTVYVFKIIDPR